MAHAQKPDFVLLRLKCDGTCAETRFRLSAKRTSPFEPAGASVQSTTGSRGVSISGSNSGYTMFRGSVKSTGYPLHSPVSPSLPLPCAIVCHHVSTGLYLRKRMGRDSSVGIASRYGPNGPEIESQWERDFPPWGPASLLYNGYRVFTGGKASHPHLAPR